MPTHAELRKGCERVLDRLRKGPERPLSCILCSLELIDDEALSQHLMLQHTVFCTPFADIACMDGFFAHLKDLLHGKALERPKESPNNDKPAAWFCPVCGVPLAEPSPAGLEEHITRESHQQWTPRTIPSLRPFCLCPSADSSTTDEEEDLSSQSSPCSNSQNGLNEDEEKWAEEGNDRSDDGVNEEDFIEPCVCLFCPKKLTDCLGHMREVHQFDFPAITRSLPGVSDEYDIIALINTVRRSLSLRRCPYCNITPTDIKKEAQKGENVPPSGENGSGKDLLEEHLLAFPLHRLPPFPEKRKDADLIPFLPGDALISLVVTSGEGFLRSEPTDPDFPMVPTLHEVIATRKAHRKDSMKKTD